MIRRVFGITVAMMILAAAPALAQCGKTCGKDKATCGSKQAKCGESCQVKTASTGGKTCSLDGKGCSKAAATCSTGAKSACGPVASCGSDAAQFKGLALPRMAYQVGDKRLTCPKSAAALAKDELTTVKYVVADKVYEEKTAAVVAHAEELNTFLDDALTVKYAVGDKCVGCPNAAKAMAKSEQKKVGYRVASFNFADREAAAKASETAREAVKQVSMKVMVGDQAFCCPKEAAAVAKNQGKEIEYCVGKAKTACEATAKLELAIARIKAALAACETSGGEQIAADV